MYLGVAAEEGVVAAHTAGLGPVTPGVEHTRGDVEHTALGFIQSQVEAQRATLRRLNAAVILVNFINPRAVFYLNHGFARIAHLGAQADVDFEGIVKPTIVIAEVFGEVAGAIGQHCTIRVVEYQIFFTNIHLGVGNCHAGGGAQARGAGGALDALNVTGDAEAGVAVGGVCASGLQRAQADAGLHGAAHRALRLRVTI